MLVSFGILAPQRLARGLLAAAEEVLPCLDRGHTLEACLRAHRALQTALLALHQASSMAPLSDWTSALEPQLLCNHRL